MKKHFLITLGLLISTCNLWAQLKDSVLIDCYGEIRADMVRTVCQIVGYKNDSVLNSVSRNSLQAFKDSISNQDTLLAIVSTAKPLDGVDVSTYWENLRDTRRDFQYRLSSFFPKKETEIENAFRKYIKQIDGLTDECNTFNGDTTSTLGMYLKAYPSGRFTNIVASITAQKALKEKQLKAKKKESKETKNDDQMGQGILYAIKTFLITLLKWCIGLIFTIVIIVLVIKKRKKIVSLAKKMYSKIMRRIEITDTENLPEAEKVEGGNHQQGSNEQQVIENVNEGKETEEQIPAENDEDGNSQETTKLPITPSDKKPDKKPQPQRIDPKGKSTAMDAGEWIIVGASVQGNGHIEMNLPCQDNHSYEYIRDGWGIAITSDGAGSAKLSHIGSAASVARAMVHFKNLIEKEKWIEKGTLPSDNDWMKLSYQTLKTVRDELEALAKTRNCDIKDLSATIIVVIHSPYGLLAVHIGDGRAGYKDMNGEWHSLITPHKGEEANQTIFIPSDFWNSHFYEMSGAVVPEPRIVREQISAFTLMSDGCESTSWLCNQYNESTGKYYDPNLPFGKFFASPIETLQSFRKDNVPIEERRNKWYQFLKDGNKKFEKETDDKTMILGALYM